MKTQEEIKDIEKELAYKPEHIAIRCPEDIEKADAFCEDYKEFLDLSKTEREVVNTILMMAEERGFKEFDPKKKLKKGDKIFFNNRGKSVILATIGKKPLDEGVRFDIAHGDCPRLDLKGRPLMEKDGFALLKTHYYGGIRKYQWTALPLAMHGVVVLKNGKKIEIRIGEEPKDPRFMISDLLPHLSKTQDERKLSEGVKGEELNIIVGNIPFAAEGVKNPVKLAVLYILNDRYGIKEQDLETAEIEMVPAEKAVDIGFDRSMISAYGQDDRSCAYSAVMAAFDVTEPEHTSITVITDKEEIGSYGNTGMSSWYLHHFCEDLCDVMGVKVRDMYRNSLCVSSDVSAAYDPTFSDVFEKQNNCQLGYGPVLEKYTGARGKSSASDASAETIARIAGILENEGVVYQTGELGKVDAGGGGTIAHFVADMDVDTIDLGVPVLSMHAPYELTSKLDIYHTYKAFSAFLRS
ncbi:MAG: aminopeptidase [Eubacteriales bacterium]|nr:aminopeptidase [Eubacteriales bacterium]